ncbi:hypothetical protein GIB67_002567 [Kingdonia uniflora]|uniref:Uncharacterized protein n=1 Tax=Kingdonia uniflora TaxID=39325 RepID=A0A7J7N407_9MAGN|nr:hypothetical protein GIB67_002567 [Kingdonia uniflora]
MKRVVMMERWFYRKGTRRLTWRVEWMPRFKNRGRFEYSSIVRGKLDSAIDSHPDTEGVKSTVERKKSLLDEVVEEETELILVLEELSLSRKKRVESRSEKVAKAQSTISMTGVDDGKMHTSRGEVRARRQFSSSEPQDEQNSTKVEEEANLDETAEERERLNRHLMLKGYSQKEVDAIKDDTYVKEEEEVAEVLGVVDWPGGVSPQMVLYNQGDDVDLPEGRSEKVELDASLVRGDHALMCNWEFAKQFDRMNEANKNRDDQCVKAHFRLEKLNQVISDMTRQVKEKDSGIKKVLADLSYATERAKNLKCQVDALAVKGKQADMAQYRIQALDRTEEQCRSDFNRSRINLEVDADIISWKDTYAMLKALLERLKARFATSIIPDISRSALLSVIVAYFVEEVNRHESKRDTLLKNLLDNGSTCRAKIDRGNCLGAIETQLGPRTAEFVE